MTYRNDILALSPDHYWTWDATHADIGVGPSAPNDTNQLGGNTAPLTGPPITEDATSSLHVNSSASRTECNDSAQMNVGSPQKYRTFGGWFQPTEIARPPSALFKEGGGTNNFAVVIGFGNTLLAQSVDRDDHDVQCYSDRTIPPNRAIHYMCRFAGSDTAASNNGVFELFVDGVLQAITDGNPFDTTEMASHGADINWGSPDGSLNVGGVSTAFAAAQGYHAHWASWTRLLNDAEIRDIFERGALPVHTVTNQAELDALAGSTISAVPLAIRVDVAGSIALSASNITFLDASIDVQYTGTGTLTWTNEGSSNASIISTPNGGNVDLITTRKMTFTGIPDGLEVRIRRGVHSLNHEPNISGGQFVFEYPFSDRFPIVASFGGAGWVRQELSLTLENTDQSIPLNFEPDPSYV